MKMWHVSPSIHRKGIEKEGLCPRRPVYWKDITDRYRRPGVYLHTKKYVAKLWAESQYNQGNPDPRYYPPGCALDLWEAEVSVVTPLLKDPYAWEEGLSGAVFCVKRIPKVILVGIFAGSGWVWK